ncbi:hypothetical protein [Sulfuriflexus sp.]|uniref:hypothetical protein n=1 Tax=Sulfuriflexus sp. TaxID=2015443 RepID=UPI0028CCAD10|nr:hypothetical protein [Sulfuriflexus sp.]MDT8403433.1 hypothetical protein [Sulfuriflexus sp.]
MQAMILTGPPQAWQHGGLPVCHPLPGRLPHCVHGQLRFKTQLASITQGFQFNQPYLYLCTTRIEVIPTIIMIFVCMVTENSALNQVLRHELPDKQVKAYPPPDVKAKP